ncbi:aminoglycoside N3-acetyltransferase [Campylobacter hyointestinalis]|uniref:AAC(3) family N-acetyltransferase n=1 Tax=Campylobacter hyointestinalis TaxID=198 RepID=UPI0004D8A723|nr:AAC(3) family N-acetyltransferase [Campylobacter hyointestinalis]ANE33113.1 aminoglycoside N3'-acetyltransferase [Campylobacter hyointestinalis subsp. hyointestinalis LMG 9260]KEA44812.1 acetyltransferase [Campylobacter hyointestinalis subsp. hyointestinalis]QKF56284.1 aminoglycoside N3'-acetyltransferase [Campylobacter hyointestinalis subsp. hyointestinalis]TXK46685.1 aminoglycoside N(3)-acetyltransferase [Campylobacter hyointestinalis]SFT45987.1 aminoglycoside 3-N-acetyltransferase [Campy
MKAILEANGKLVKKSDFLDALEQIGIKSGDAVCVHTELFTLGKPLLPKDEFLRVLLECFYEVIGKNGTLIMPTFTYSFCKNKIYDKLNSRSTMGVLTEFFRHQNGVVRTNDPIFSFAINGANKDAFLSDTKSCFGKNSVYDVLKKMEGKIVLLGNQKLGYTFTHYIEEQAEVSYRYFKEFSGKIVDENGKISSKSILYFVRDIKKRSILAVEKQVSILKSTYNFHTSSIGGSTITLIKADKYFKDTISALRKDEQILLKM